jgi:hypothetical protein
MRAAIASACFRSRLPAELLERDLGALGQRRPGGHEGGEGVGHELRPFERPLRERQHGEDQVEQAALELLQVLEVGDRLAQVDRDAGPLGQQQLERLREDLGARGLEGAHPDDARPPDRERVHLGLGRGNAGGDRLGVLQEQAPGRGERDGTAAGRPLQERLPYEPLEHRDLLAHGGLAVPEAPCGSLEGLLLGNRPQRDEMPQLDSEPRSVSYCCNRRRHRRLYTGPSISGTPPRRRCSLRRDSAAVVSET